MRSLMALTVARKERERTSAHAAASLLGSERMRARILVVVARKTSQVIFCGSERDEPAFALKLASLLRERHQDYPGEFPALRSPAPALR